MAVNCTLCQNLTSSLGKKGVKLAVIGEGVGGSAVGAGVVVAAGAVVVEGCGVIPGGSENGLPKPSDGGGVSL